MSYLFISSEISGGVTGPGDVINFNITIIEAKSIKNITTKLTQPILLTTFQFIALALGETGIKALFMCLLIADRY